MFGVNDGLVSNVSLVLGVAGAGAASAYVLTAGVAGLLAGALSMAAGEYVSVRSQREMYEYQIALEREELAEYPEEEAEELALIYQARGVELEQARAVSRSLLVAPAAGARCAGARGARPQPRRSRLALAGGRDLLRRLCRRCRHSAAPVSRRVRPPCVRRSARHCSRSWRCSPSGSLCRCSPAADAVRSALRMVLIGGGAGAVSFLVGRALGVAIG